MTEENKTRDALDAAKGLVEAIPVYQDVAQPAAQEVGKALQTVAKTVHIALAPVSALVWGYDQIREFVSTRVAEKLKNVPEDEIVSPKTNVAGPALEALRYTGHEDELREMYANLLASSMDSKTANSAHPAFVEVIKQLTPDEARLIRHFMQPIALPFLVIRKEFKTQTATERGGIDLVPHFSLLGQQAGCQFPNSVPTYIDNLVRLGLCEIPEFFEYTSPGVYEPLEKHPTVEALKKRFESDEKWNVSLERKGIKVTSLGKQFASACITPHEKKRPAKGS